MTMKLPVGIDDFAKLRREGFYYIDKTGLIEDLMENWAEVNLFTRPRRFGKTLNMSMLRSYYEIGTDPSLFEGLRISENRELCDAHMGRYPVVFVSLKDVDGLTFEEAQRNLQSVIRAEAMRHYELKTSDRVSVEYRQIFEEMLQGQYAVLSDSLRLLSEMLSQHYGQKAIILIDEYDVPLDKAFHHGYYREMVSLIRGFLSKALKTNPALQMAVLTGCMRVSKESIFTGLNNLKVLSITDVRFNEWFGFTDEEVRRLLADYRLSDHDTEIKEWYDGYHFGGIDVYCPWDVINHADLLREDPMAEPQAYWINTSSNDLVRRFVSMADQTTRDEIERLIAGESIEKAVRLDLTYDEVDRSIDNLWSVLFTTGYLTQEGRAQQGRYRLRIPNREVREVYIAQIQEWFSETVLQNKVSMQSLCQAFLQGDAESIEAQLNTILRRTISIQDSRAREGYRESFYHGLLLGLLRSEPEWWIHSNTEAGDGYSDIIVEPEDVNAGIVIEVKYAQTVPGLARACEAAMEQIHARRYDEYLRDDGRENILAYGIAFCKKRCRVTVEQLRGML